MKIKIKNVKNQDIYMQTSERGRDFSICFHDIDGKRNDNTKYWGHLSEPQCYRLLEELKHFLQSLNRRTYSAMVRKDENLNRGEAGFIDRNDVIRLHSEFRNKDEAEFFDRNHRVAIDVANLITANAVHLNEIKRKFDSIEESISEDN